MVCCIAIRTQGRWMEGTDLNLAMGTCYRGSLEGVSLASPHNKFYPNYVAVDR